MRSSLSACQYRAAVHIRSFMHRCVTARRHGSAAGASQHHHSRLTSPRHGSRYRLLLPYRPRLCDCARSDSPGKNAPCVRVYGILGAKRRAVHTARNTIPRCFAIACVPYFLRRGLVDNSARADRGPCFRAGDALVPRPARRRAAPREQPLKPALLFPPEFPPGFPSCIAFGKPARRPKQDGRGVVALVPHSLALPVADAKWPFILGGGVRGRLRLGDPRGPARAGLLVLAQSPAN
mmetsp:Transcript_39469/g.97439  ORF Transcript_39469/g.97439 Transcript_39469/m.97439 type:complete len:236 (+) Transcript_39469:1016-1723(+)